MPVEIRELIIRATVKAGNQEKDWDSDSPVADDGVDKSEAIVQECVRQVLRILRKERER